MQFSGALTLSDVRSGLWLHIAPRRSMAILGAVILALAVGSFALMLMIPGVSDDWMVWLLPFAILYLSVYFFVLVPYRIKKSYSQHKALQRVVTFTTADEGLAFANENATGRVPWTDFRKWKENHKIFLLYITDQRFYVVPKRFFSRPADSEEFSAILKTRIHKQ